MDGIAEKMRVVFLLEDVIVQDNDELNRKEDSVRLAEEELRRAQEKLHKAKEELRLTREYSEDNQESLERARKQFEEELGMSRGKLLAYCADHQDGIECDSVNDLYKYKVLASYANYHDTLWLKPGNNDLMSLAEKLDIGMYVSLNEPGQVHEQQHQEEKNEQKHPEVEQHQAQEQLGVQQQHEHEDTDEEVNSRDTLLRRAIAMHKQLQENWRSKKD